MNANETLKQIGTGNLMACGARDFVQDGAQLLFRVGSKRGVLAKIVITLEPSDTYSVRYVELRQKDWKFINDEIVSDVYCDQLGATVRRMGDR